MSLLTRFVSKSRHVATDTYALASSLLSARPTSIPSVRDVLIRSTRNDSGNIVAASVLRVDREIGLVRYHGLGGYVNAKGGIRGILESGNGAALTRSADTTSNSSGGFNLTSFLFGPPSGRGRDIGSQASTGTDIANNNTVSSAQQRSQNNQKKARVAFMITSAQRMQLTSQLGYTATDIRSLRPLEALIILEHGIEPGNDGEVQRLVAENKELEREEARRAEMELAEAEAAAEAAAIAEAQSGTSSDEQSERAEQVQPDESESSSATQRESTDATRLALAAGSSGDTSQTPAPTPIQHDSSTSLSGSISHQSAAVQKALSLPLADGEQKNGEDGLPTEEMSNNAEENIWYEVVETSKSREEMGNAASTSTGESTVVALYQTLEEAEDCLEWKEQRGQDRYKYEIRER